MSLLTCQPHVWCILPCVMEWAVSQRWSKDKDWENASFHVEWKRLCQKRWSKDRDWEKKMRKTSEHSLHQKCAPLLECTVLWSIERICVKIHFNHLIFEQMSNPQCIGQCTHPLQSSIGGCEVVVGSNLTLPSILEGQMQEAPSSTSHRVRWTSTQVGW